MRRALRQVREVYQWHNEGLFGGRLRAPLLEWSESCTQLGSFSPGSRTLRLSTELLEQPWLVLVEVLKHEMAHQFVLETLGITDEGPHGPSFLRVCHERGIDAGTRGLPGVPLPGAGEPQRTEEERRRVARIEGLLALATSDNPHEAETAMATARRLMLKYNIEDVKNGVRSRYGFRQLGKPTGRRMAWQRVLANLLSAHFFVEVIIVPVFRPVEGKRGSVLEASGTPENLELASYVHDFLERSALSLWKSHKKREGLRRDTDRQSYLYGLMCGFRDKLEKEAQRSVEEGLIWVSDPALSEFFRRRHPHVRHVGSATRLRSDAFSAGHEAGGRIVLHRGVEAGRTGQGVRLLGAGGRG